MSVAPIAVLGGTFNPIHYGHLRSALELRERLQLAEVRLMPSARPPHREAPDCPASARVELVELAVANEQGLRCDPRELHRQGPSYTFDSLAEIRAEIGSARSLILVLGTDALASLDSWYRWRELLDLAHIVTITRPGVVLPVDGVMGDWIAQHVNPAEASLQASAAGQLHLVSLRPLAISASEIRELIREGRSPRYLLPDSVWKKIQSAGLYGAKREQ